MKTFVNTTQKKTILAIVTGLALAMGSSAYAQGVEVKATWREDWIAPTGYVARDWKAGETLPAEYLDGRFTVVWNTRNLPFPGEDRMWVRVGKDALLVHTSGRIDLVIKHFYF